MCSTVLCRWEGWKTWSPISPVIWGEHFKNLAKLCLKLRHTLTCLIIYQEGWRAVLPEQLILWEVHLLRHRPLLKTKLNSNLAPFLLQTSCVTGMSGQTHGQTEAEYWHFPDWGNPGETLMARNKVYTPPSWVSAVLYQPFVHGVMAKNVPWAHKLNFLLLLFFFCELILLELICDFPTLKFCTWCPGYILGDLILHKTFNGFPRSGKF